jgi:hypothetical protein
MQYAISMGKANTRSFAGSWKQMPCRITSAGGKTIINQNKKRKKKRKKR